MTWNYRLAEAAAYSSEWTRKTAWNLVQHKVLRYKRAEHHYGGPTHCSKCRGTEKRFLESLIRTVVLARTAWS